MMAGQPVRVAVIGAEFIPIYQRHPQAEMAAICRRDRACVDEVGDQFGVESRYTDDRELLKDSHSDLTARVCRSLFDVARQYRESSANWTCVGLCAHESALNGGELVRLPEFTLR